LAPAGDVNDAQKMHVRRWRSSKDGLSCCSEALQLVADVLKIAGIDVGREYFVDNRQEVGERSNDTQRLGRVRPGKTTDSRKSECILDSGKRKTALVKLFSEQTVGTACNATGTRSRTISCEQAADILLLFHERRVSPADRGGKDRQ
jgi:hypothetical protein